MSEVTEKATDMEVALNLAYHIDNPCGTKINGKWVTLRNHYIKRAQSKIFESPRAVKFLRDKIKEYS